MMHQPTALTPLGGIVTCVIAAFTVFAAGCDDQISRPKTNANVLIGSAQAQQMDLVIPPTAVSGAMAPVDQAFALFIASSSLAEIDGARSILKSSRNADVIDYAQKLIRDHGVMGEDLKRIVAPRGVNLPSQPTGRHADMVTKLAGVAPAERDDAFIQRFGIDAHKEAIAAAERHVKEGTDPALKRYAEQVLIMLREHMSMAHKLAYAATTR